jgi:hypothetical protein
MFGKRDNIRRIGSALLLPPVGAPFGALCFDVPLCHGDEDSPQRRGVPASAAFFAEGEHVAGEQGNHKAAADGFALFDGAAFDWLA